MKRKRIYLSSPTMHGEEKKYIEEAFESNWVAPLGTNVNELERELASYMGVGYAAALSSGTSAIHLAVKLCGVKEGDLVLCQDLTFAATVNPVCYEGGIPVLIDAEYETWNMDPEELREAFEKYAGRVKAVIAVNLYGMPAKLDEIVGVCLSYGVPLIEDAAESLSSRYKGRQTGTFGTYSCVSFNGNKIITTSGGGMLLSDNEESIRKARFWSTQSREEKAWYEHREIGYNYRMSNIVAGIGRGQLKHIEEHKAKKKKIYETYKRGLEGLPLSLNPISKDVEPNYWLSCLLIDQGETERSGATPEKIRRELEKENIEARPIWKPMHLQPLYKEKDFIHRRERDVGADLFARGLCLPSDIKMTEEEQETVIRVISRCFENRFEHPAARGRNP